MGAFPLREQAGDAAILVSLGPGNYSVEVAAPLPGVALAEVYDAGERDGSLGTKLINIATRGRVAANEPLIAGFVISVTIRGGY